MTARWLLVLALIPSTAFAAHPLCIDDAGTVAAGTRELELSSQILDLDTGREHGFGAAGRLGLTRQLDAGLAALWVPAPADGDVWEFLLDLKWAPGYAVDWRPRPFLRPDFALLVGGGQAEVSMAGLHAGLSWEGRRGLLTAELGWIEPLDRDFGSAEAWRAGIGVDAPVVGRWRVAAQWIRAGLVSTDADLARAGLILGSGRGDLSAGLQFGPGGERGRVGVVLGWTGTFGD